MVNLYARRPHLSFIVGPLVECLQLLLPDVGSMLLTQRKELMNSNGPVPRGVLVRNLSVRFYIVGRVRLRMGANAQIGEN